MRIGTGQKPMAFDALRAHGRLEGTILLPKPEKGVVGVVTVFQPFEGVLRPVLDLDLDLALEAVGDLGALLDSRDLHKVQDYCLELLAVKCYALVEDIEVPAGIRKLSLLPM